MDKEVEDLVKHCITCKSNDKNDKSGFAPLMPVQYPSNAWSKLSMDIVGPFERGPNECRFAITLIDYHSKWPEVCFTSTVTSSKCIEFLKQIFSREGFPDELITDHGVQFMSYEFESFLSERGIKHGHSSIYYPQANGAIERFNSVLKNTLQDVIDAGKYWKSHVIEFLAVYRATPHATTGLSPSVLLHQRYMRTKLNIIGYKLPDVKIDVHRVKEKVQVQQSKYKFHADKKRNVTNVGDWVRMKKPGFVPKGSRRYSDPVQIRHKLSFRTYVLQDGKTWNVSKLVKSSEPDECYISENDDVCSIH
jgi:transposase InsO family protein